MSFGHMIQQARSYYESKIIYWELSSKVKNAKQESLEGGEDFIYI